MSMEIEFYTVNDDYRKINKTLNNPTVLNCNIRTDIDIYNPRLLIKQWNEKYNYFRWQDRYYFVTDNEYTAKQVYDIQSHIDVLMTYKNEILNAMCLITQSTKINPYYNGGDYNYLENYDTYYYKSDIELPNTFNSVLVTLGV